MAWRVALSLNRLLHQLNDAYPRRSKEADGAIGDEAHATRSSDHNPWVKDGSMGVVTARDFSNDAPYMDSHKLALALVASHDPRIKYVIDHSKICSGSGGPSPWVWRKYTGINPHDHHCHVSVVATKKLYDDESDWDIDMELAPTKDDGTVTIPPPKQVITPRPILRVGAQGAAVAHLQELLIKNGAKIKADGDFGPLTKTALVAYQNKNKLVPDGVVGPYTWRSLEGE